MQDLPVFDITLINPPLYNQVPDLKKIKVRLSINHNQLWILISLQWYSLSGNNFSIWKIFYFHVIKILKTWLVRWRRNENISFLIAKFFLFKDLVDTAQGVLLPYLHKFAESFIIHVKECQVAFFVLN